MENEQKMLEWDKEYIYKRDKKKQWVERGVSFFVVVAMILGWVWTSGSINSSQNELIKFNKELIVVEVTDRKIMDDYCIGLIDKNAEAIEKTSKNTQFIIGQLDVLLNAKGLVYKPKEDTL